MLLVVPGAGSEPGKIWTPESEAAPGKKSALWVPGGVNSTSAMPRAQPNAERAPELDAWHMCLALELARQGQGRVEPNPLVGCVIARGAEIIGEGWHACYGGPHAEIEALAVAGRRAAGATMFVTLEPCCHFGKTPPCTQAILDAEIHDVIVAAEDPFPQVSGQGIAALRAAGVHVDVGLLRDEALALDGALPETTGHGSAVGHRQMGHDARRSHRQHDRRQPLDLERPIARDRASPARPRGRDHRGTRHCAG